MDVLTEPASRTLLSRLEEVVNALEEEPTSSLLYTLLILAQEFATEPRH